MIKAVISPHYVAVPGGSKNSLEVQVWSVVFPLLIAHLHPAE